MIFIIRLNLKVNAEITKMLTSILFYYILYLKCKFPQVIGIAFMFLI